MIKLYYIVGGWDMKIYLFYPDKIYHYILPKEVEGSFSFDVDKNYSLSFLLEVYFADLLALYVGKLRKVNIDKPRNLAKSVTVE